MFYDTFEKMCAEMEVSPADVRKTVGVSQSTMASWKSRGLTPKYETLKKLSDYFGVSVDYLLGKTELLSTGPFVFRPKKGISGFSESIEAGLREKRSDLFEYENELGYEALMRVDEAFTLLNDDGISEAVKRVEELTEIPRYRAAPAQELQDAECKGGEEE